MENVVYASDRVDVVHGRWIEPVPGDGFPFCSNCKRIAPDNGLFLNAKLMEWYMTPFCPWCGAKMDGERRQEHGEAGEHMEGAASASI